MMKAIILTAGEGTRMRPLTLTKPKTMLPVAGKPIIQYNIEYLKEAGIHDILLIVGYKEEYIRNYFGDGSDLGVNISYKTQEERIGTANAIEHGENFAEDSVLVLNGDIILDKELLVEIIKEYEKNDADTMIVLTEVEDPRPFGVVKINKQGYIEEIVEKPATIEESPSHLINTGIYVFNKNIFKKIKKTTKSKRGEYEITDSLTLQIQAGKKVKGFRTVKKWLDIGRPWELIDINEQLLEDLETEIKGTVEDGVTIHGAVHLGEGSLLKSGTYIEGPIYIGKNTTIGPNTYLRGKTSIGDNVHIGNAVEIKNSIIMNNTNVGHLSYVGDSVLGEYCNVGAGTNFANLRFDDKTTNMRVKGELVDTGRRKMGSIFADEAKTGINVTINPGITVGHHSWIGSGVILINRDVEPYKFVTFKQDYEEYDNIECQIKKL